MGRLLKFLRFPSLKPQAADPPRHWTPWWCLSAVLFLAVPEGLSAHPCEVETLVQQLDQKLGPFEPEEREIAADLLQAQCLEDQDRSHPEEKPTQLLGIEFNKADPDAEGRKRLTRKR